MTNNGYFPEYDITLGENSYFAKCLKFGKNNEDLLKKILEELKIEIKTDKIYKITGNLFIEFESRGKSSGITKTTADYWAFCLWSDDRKLPTFILVPTKELKKLIENNNYKEVKGGDNYTSLGYLIPATELIKLT